jgi:2-dehydropantoate 2-reductase
VTSLEGGNFGPIVTNIALVGPGAVGTTVAALLHKAGHSVLVCGRTARDAIELRPDGADPIVVPGPVRTDPDTVDGPVDVVILAVKATQNDEAGGWLARLCDERTIVLVLQNGVEQVELVGPLAGGARVVPSVVWFPAEAAADGRVTHGPFDSGPPVGYWAFITDPDGHNLELSHGQEVAFTVGQRMTIATGGSGDAGT